MSMSMSMSMKMEQQLTPNQNQDQDEDDDELIVSKAEAEGVIKDLPKTPVTTNFRLVKYQGFWCPDDFKTYMPSILSFQKHFQARHTDLIVSSFPKTGTTWLKSLLFSVVNRKKYGTTNPSPLHNKHPHELVYRLEVDVYGNAFDFPRPHHLDQLPSPRLFSTHLPYISLPESIQDSGCKLIYIARNPMDSLVSQWYFMTTALKKLEDDQDFRFCSMEKFFDVFMEGKVVHGPFFDHVAEYWKRSLERPDKVLFLKYEDLKDDPVGELRKLAEFVGVPFSSKEESEGVIEEIVGFCSIGSLKEMEGNKSGVINKFYEKKSYFRKGEVGDWIRHFSPSMVERINEVMKDKFEPIGLSFKLGPTKDEKEM